MKKLGEKLIKFGLHLIFNFIPTLEKLSQIFNILSKTLINFSLNRSIFKLSKPTPTFPYFAPFKSYSLITQFQLFIIKTNPRSNLISGDYSKEFVLVICQHFEFFLINRVPILSNFIFLKQYFQIKAWFLQRWFYHLFNFCFIEYLRWFRLNYF